MNVQSCGSIMPLALTGAQEWAPRQGIGWTLSPGR
jgi:hypothetical protein